MSTPQHPPPEIPGHAFVRFVASGGFGAVFVYRDNIGRDVAIKVLHASGLTPEARDAFQVEAARMARIRSRFIVTVYGFGIADDGRPYISMEYCPDNLGSVVQRRSLPVADVLRSTIQVCSAVAAAHQEDLFHRDIKPANILLTHDGAPALTDFGIAGGRGAQPGDVRGLSLRYAAPEVIAGHSDGEECADTYSLAATAYKLLSGRAPYEVPGGDNTGSALIERTLSGRLSPMDRVDVPPSLERVLAGGLATDPQLRYASPTSLARALQAVELELGFSETVVPFDDVGVLGDDAARDVDDDDGTRFSAPQRVDPDGASNPKFDTRSRGLTAGTAGALVAAPPGPVITTPGSPTGRRPAGHAPTGATSTGGDVTQATELRTGRARPAPAADDQEPVTRRAGSSGGRGRIVLAGSAAVLVRIVATVLLASRSAPSDPSSETTVDDDPATHADESPLFTTPTVPVGVEVAREDGGVRVTWEPDSVPDVTYVVTPTAGVDDGSTTTDATSVLLTTDDADEQVCVRVLAVLGSTSTEPSREVCTR